MSFSGRMAAAAVLLWFALLQPGLAADCGGKRYCRDMANCAEAAHYLKDCGLRRLDGDSDGIPCEALCGKSMDAFQRRVGKQSKRALVPAVHQCGVKRTCRQMHDCAEAQFYLSQCGLKSLDRNKDGVPCEALCR